MINITGSHKGANLPYADFIGQIHKYSFQNETETKLRGMLSRYAGLEEKRAAVYSILREIIRRKTGLALFDSHLFHAVRADCGASHGRRQDVKRGGCGGSLRVADLDVYDK